MSKKFLRLNIPVSEDPLSLSAEHVVILKKEAAQNGRSLTRQATIDLKIRAEKLKNAI